MLRFGFDPGTDVFRFCGMFWYHSNSVMNREGTKMCPVLYGSEIWAMLLCVQIMLICAYMKIVMNGNYM